MRKFLTIIAVLIVLAAVKMESTVQAVAEDSDPNMVCDTIKSEGPDGTQTKVYCYNREQLQHASREEIHKQIDNMTEEQKQEMLEQQQQQQEQLAAQQKQFEEQMAQHQRQMQEQQRQMEELEKRMEGMFKQ